MTPHATALSAYESLAHAYDDLTVDHEHDRWLELLERLAVEHGLAGRDVLDVACGTGKSFLPLVERGYRVVARDLSPGMAALAAAKAPGVEVGVADMRALDVGGRRFDLVTCLSDAINHLLDEASLRAAFRQAAAALRPGGLYVFDVNTVRAFREEFGTTWRRRLAGRTFVWEAVPLEPDGPGCLGDGVMHVAGAPGGDADGPVAIRMQERHFPQRVVRDALAAAGLECRAVRGLQPDGTLSPDVDELRDTKAIYVACHTSTREEVS
ncbi:MAG TPA: class I SAM-dependent methyltransferase [Solirubrobacteraceae bacterium]|jgi:SAM-dependent methyltransferase|nr:class I SAM-dependent methyltransferase [Solirubrobacteraceae bacterium]